MKKIVGIIIVIIFAAVGFLAARYGVDYTNTHSKFWQEVSTSEMSMTIPKSMKKGQNYRSSTGWESVAVYSNSKASAVVAKSSNAEFQNLNIESYINSISVNGTKLTASKINNGYYTKYVGGDASSENTSDKSFNIEGFFQGKDAIYDVKFSCSVSDRDEYESAMMEWLESFQLK